MDEYIVINTHYNSTGHHNIGETVSYPKGQAERLLELKAIARKPKPILKEIKKKTNKKK